MITTEIKTAILIHAKPQQVWKILIDFDNYPKWNPFIKSLQGEVKIGNQITVQIAPPDASGMTFKPKVLAFETNKEFRWIGRLLFSGIFDGEHQFELVDNGDGTTTFLQSEKFKGILVPFLKGQLNNNTKRGFVLMNEKIKKLAENQL